MKHILYAFLFCFLLINCSKDRDDQFDKKEQWYVLELNGEKISGENTVAYRINPRPKDPLNKDEVSAYTRDKDAIFSVLISNLPEKGTQAFCRPTTDRGCGMGKGDLVMNVNLISGDNRQVLFAFEGEVQRISENRIKFNGIDLNTKIKVAGDIKWIKK